MDYDLFSRLKLLYEFNYIDFYFSKYRLHNESKSTTAIAKFIDEWTIIFNSIAEGLEIKKVKKVLTENDLITDTDPVIAGFYKDNRNRKTFDEDKLIYYFLVNVIRYDYATSKFDRVKKISLYLKKTYGNYLNLEPSVLKIVKRSLTLPPFFLTLARNIKRSFVKE
jgi:hypothetical protein